MRIAKVILMPTPAHSIFHSTLCAATAACITLGSLAYASSLLSVTHIMLALISGACTGLIAYIAQAPLRQLATAIHTQQLHTVPPLRGELESIRSTHEALLQEHTAAYKLKQMIDHMPINVMSVDVHNDFKIDYINETSVNTLKTVQSYLKVDVTQLLGQSIDIFHKHPQHQRNLLADPSNLPHHAKIQLGSEYMALKVSAIYDIQGRYTGAMLTWNIITQQVKLADNFQAQIGTIVSSVASAATQLSQTAQHMGSLIQRTSQKAESSAHNAHVTSENVQSVAAAAEEMTATVNEISSQIGRSNTLVVDSVQAVAEADTHAASLGHATQRVRDVIQLISDIAGQINLLALNATIESARAGDAGKGFAVVAGEVKNLAGQTERSIQEIERVIADMNEASSNIIHSLNDIKTKVASIAESSSGIASAVEEQSATTGDIASNMQSAAQGTHTISTHLKEVSASSADSQHAAEQVLAAANELSRQSEMLDTEVERFLVNVRSM